MSLRGSKPCANNDKLRLSNGNSAPVRLNVIRGDEAMEAKGAAEAKEDMEAKEAMEVKECMSFKGMFK